MNKLLLASIGLLAALSASAQDVSVRVFDADKKVLVQYLGPPNVITVDDSGEPVVLDLFEVKPKGSQTRALTLNIVKGSRSAKFYTEGRFIEGAIEGSAMQVIVDRQPGALK